MKHFEVYRVFEEQGASRGSVVRMDLSELDAGDVVIKTAFAGVNYKDALAGTGRAPVVRRFPCVGGIEAVGVVVQSCSVNVQEGDEVIVHGRGLGVSHDGGFARYVRVPSEWITSLPPGLKMHEAATIGVAGHTAAVAVDLMEHNGLTPGRGPVAVTGATGGVASLAIDILSNTGYEVVAVSRKKASEDYLRALGACEIIPPPDRDSPSKPLESAQWAGAVDAVGGPILPWLLSKMMPNGTVACFGNAAGIDLNTTVLPFILRGVRLLGVNADTAPDYRRHIWTRLTTDLKPRYLESIVTYIDLEDLPQVFDRMVAGETQGRHVVKFQ